MASLMIRMTNINGTKRTIRTGAESRSIQRCPKDNGKIIPNTAIFRRGRSKSEYPPDQRKSFHSFQIIVDKSFIDFPPASTSKIDPPDSLLPWKYPLFLPQTRRSRL